MPLRLHQIVKEQHCFEPQSSELRAGSVAAPFGVVNTAAQKVLFFLNLPIRNNDVSSKTFRHYHQWRRSGSNRQPLPCKGSALPVELRPLKFTGAVAIVGVRGLEPRTSALSELRSNHLSYTPRIRNVFGVRYSGIALAKCPAIRFMHADFPSL